MSLKDHWLLPAGIDEVLPPSAARVEALRRDVLDLFDTWGYQLVIPPLIEYMESLLTGVGTDLDLQTFKIIDQCTGRLMGVRADMTPQVARIDAHRLKHTGPNRLCYLGPVLHTLPRGFAESRNPIQIGAELFGHDGLESDVEILCLMLETLGAAGASSIYVDLGHVGIFRGLARQAGIDRDQEIALFDALQRKARPEVEASMHNWRVARPVAEMITALVDLNGDVSVLADAEQVLRKAGASVRYALEDLICMAQLAKRRAPATTWHYDLAELRGYHYHTGVVFAAYVPGQGQALSRGGRYNNIGRVFGRARPATGFSTDLKSLASLVPAQRAISGGICAPWSDDPALADTIADLRRQGRRVIYALPGVSASPESLQYDKKMEQRNGHWVVVDV